MQTVMKLYFVILHS